MKKNCIKGRCYNISLNGKKAFLGWFLIISDNGQEYLVERNGTMSCGCFRKVYQQTILSYRILNFLNKSNNLPAIAGTSIGLILARMLRKIIPLKFFLWANKSTNEYRNWSCKYWCGNRIDGSCYVSCKIL